MTKTLLEKKYNLICFALFYYIRSRGGKGEHFMSGNLERSALPPPPTLVGSMFNVFFFNIVSDASFLQKKD